MLSPRAVSHCLICAWPSPGMNSYTSDFEWLQWRNGAPAEVSCHNCMEERDYPDVWNNDSSSLRGSCREQLAATNQKVGQMSLYWVAGGGHPRVRIWKEPRSIANCHCPGGALTWLERRTSGSDSWPGGWASQAASNRKGQIQSKSLFVCLKDCHSRWVGLGSDKQRGTGIKSKEKKKPCRGIVWYDGHQTSRWATQSGNKVRGWFCILNVQILNCAGFMIFPELKLLKIKTGKDLKKKKRADLAQQLLVGFSRCFFLFCRLRNGYVKYTA